MNIKFKEGSYINEIMRFIALSGEFPYRSLYLLNGSEEMYKRNVRKLKEAGCVTVTGSADDKTIRFKKTFLPIVEEKLGNDYFEHYMIESENHKIRGGESGSSQKKRRHRVAEVISMMDSVDVKLLRHEKPVLDFTPTELKFNLDDKLFYGSKEIKNIDEERSPKTSFTRYIGMLTSPGGVYCVYNINNSLIKWNSNSESKVKVTLENVVKYNFNVNPRFKMDDAIMFGKDVELIERILTSTGSKKDVNNFELLSFDNTFKNIHFLTLDENGKRQLNMIQQKGWHNKLLNLFFKAGDIALNTTNVDCDAYVKASDTYALLMFDGNIGRLKRFKQAADNMPDKNFQVVCFDYQKDTIKKYVGDKVVVKEFESEILFEKLEV